MDQEQKPNFKGTGYQCLGKMIENDMKGRIIREPGVSPEDIVIYPNGHLVYLITKDHVQMSFLKEQCEYVYPVEIYTQVKCWEALKAFTEGKKVQVCFTKRGSEYGWQHLTNLTWYYWADTDYSYRVLQ